MALNNTLTKTTNTDPMAFEYESNGEKVTLSPATVRKYLVSGGGKVDDQEVMMFLTLCRYQHLNPFLKEAYLIKYGSEPATIVPGKDLFTKRASHNPNYLGKEAGVIVRNKETGELTNREGSFFAKETEEIVGGWAKVFIKGREKPEYQSVSFNEYAGRKGDGTLNKQWSSKPGTMIRKVAVVQALKEAFPDDYEGLVAPEEMGNSASVVFEDVAPVIEEVPIVEVKKPETVSEEPKAPAPDPTPAPSTDDDEITQMFFGGENK